MFLIKSSIVILSFFTILKKNKDAKFKTIYLKCKKGFNKMVLNQLSKFFKIDLLNIYRM